MWLIVVLEEFKDFSLVVILYILLLFFQGMTENFVTEDMAQAVEVNF